MSVKNIMLQQFLDLKVSKDELISIINSSPRLKEDNKPIVVNAKNVIKLLEEYKIGNITIKELLEWVNIIWFTDWYEYSNENCDSIASVMNELEELDEIGNMLNNEKIDRYINALIKNEEI